MLLDIGNWGYFIGAAGILVFTLLYTIVVKRWWKDPLGLVLGFVLITVCLVVVTSAVRLWWVYVPEWFFWVRTSVFWLFALAVWSALVLFVWAQFFAPRLRDRTTRREQSK